MYILCIGTSRLVECFNRRNKGKREKYKLYIYNSSKERGRKVGM